MIPELDAFPASPEALLYCEQQVVAIDKPAGLPAQAAPGSAQAVMPWTFGLLARQAKAQRELYLVHRLDQETSGVLLLATSRQRSAWLAGEFRARRVQKVYLALCHGVAAQAEFVASAPLTRLDGAGGRVRVDHRLGRPASTKVRVLAVAPARGLSLVACQPATGRTHQIRVHLALHGLPIVGDQRYALRPESLPPGLRVPRHLLHAYSLGFCPSPRQAAVTLTAPVPADVHAAAAWGGAELERALMALAAAALPVF